MGGEWIIIIFVALIVLLGTHKLPEIAKKLGKATGEYKKAKGEFENQIKDFSNTNLDVNGPVQNERQKLEVMAKSLGINFEGKSDDELRNLISSKIGQPQSNQNTENKK